MKQAVVLSLALAWSAAMPATGHAQSGHVTHTGAKGAETGNKAQGTVHKGVGVVRKVDPARNSITLAHERIASLNWPPMVMAFAVKDKALFDKLQAGRKVEFEFVQQGKEYLITSVK
jgi:Cu(I)/Ag(I) efflux system protein CusF